MRWFDSSLFKSHQFSWAWNLHASFRTDKNNTFWEKHVIASLIICLKNKLQSTYIKWESTLTSFFRFMAFWSLFQWLPLVFSFLYLLWVGGCMDAPFEHYINVSRTSHALLPTRFFKLGHQMTEKRTVIRYYVAHIAMYLWQHTVGLLALHHLGLAANSSSNAPPLHTICILFLCSL